MFGSVTDGIGSGSTSFWDFLPTIEDVKNDVSGAYDTTKKVVSTVGGDIGSGISYVAGGVGSAVSSVADFGISRIVLLLVVIGGVLYFVLGTGAIKFGLPL